MAKKKERTIHPVLLGVFVVSLLVTAVVLYFVFFSEPDVELETQGAETGSTSVSTESIDPRFKTDVFSDPRVKQLRQFGPPEIQPTQRGVKENPFEAF